VKRLELSGFNEFEDIRRLVSAAPKLTWLDVGKRGTNSIHNRANPNIMFNVVEWATLLSQLLELTAFHGIRFFYEAAEGDPNALTLSERSRIRKNDEVAAVLSWKCPKLRRVDHWEEHSGKLIVLIRDGDKVKWEVRRCKT